MSPSEGCLAPLHWWSSRSILHHWKGSVYAANLSAGLSRLTVTEMSPLPRTFHFYSFTPNIFYKSIQRKRKKEPWAQSINFLVFPPKINNASPSAAHQSSALEPKWNTVQELQPSEWALITRSLVISGVSCSLTCTESTWGKMCMCHWRRTSTPAVWQTGAGLEVDILR